MNSGQCRVQAEHPVELQQATIITGFSNSEFTSHALIVSVTVRRSKRETINGAAQYDEHKSGAGIGTSKCQRRHARGDHAEPGCSQNISSAQHAHLR